jgi:hypothetical protein
MKHTAQAAVRQLLPRACCWLVQQVLCCCIACAATAASCWLFELLASGCLTETSGSVVQTSAARLVPIVLQLLLPLLVGELGTNITVAAASAAVAAAAAAAGSPR